jgi:hypothetical protein
MLKAWTMNYETSVPTYLWVEAISIANLSPTIKTNFGATSSGKNSSERLRLNKLQILNVWQTSTFLTSEG